MRTQRMGTSQLEPEKRLEADAFQESASYHDKTGYAFMEKHHPFIVTTLDLLWLVLYISLEPPQLSPSERHKMTVRLLQITR